MRVQEASTPATTLYPFFVEKRIPPELGFHEMHISQIRSYASGHSQPTLEAIRKLALASSLSADRLLFFRNECGPGDDLKLQFEATSWLDADEKNVIRSVIESIVLRNTVKTAERHFPAAESGGSRP